MVLWLHSLSGELPGPTANEVQKGEAFDEIECGLELRNADCLTLSKSDHVGATSF